MGAAQRTRLDQKLLAKIADKAGKPEKYVREQISKRASRLGISSEAAQVLWAKDLDIGTLQALRKLDPHIQEQVRSSLPSLMQHKARKSGTEKAKGAKRSRKASSLSLAIDYLIADSELKSRCGDLLRRTQYQDRVLREATTVLEDRIRSLSGIKESLNPEPLVNRVLNADPKKAVLVVSSDGGEQAGFHSICRGIMLAFRNPSHHGLDDKVSQEDALKFCAFIDTLLDVLAKSTTQ